MCFPGIRLVEQTGQKFQSLRVCLEEKTRRERLKSAPYLRLKKRKTFFLEKNLVIFEKKILSKKVA